MMEEKFYNLFEESFKIISHCPVCNNRYDPVEAKVISERDDSHLVYIKCRNCYAAILAVILANNLGISSIGLLTDLTSDEVIDFKDMMPVNSDDVIALHQFLQQEKVLIDHLL